MIALDINLDGDGAWPDLAAKKAEGKLLPPGALAGVALLAEGTESGKHTVMFRVDLPDGSVATAETTLALLHGAMVAMKTRALMQGQDLEA